MPKVAEKHNDIERFAPRRTWWNHRYVALVRERMETPGTRSLWRACGRTGHDPRVMTPNLEA